MDEENQINEKLKIIKFSLLPCGRRHTLDFFSYFYVIESEEIFGKIVDIFKKYGT